MPLTSQTLEKQLQLADELMAGRDLMFEPQDLPGRYGRVVHALDQLLTACDCEAVVGGGWAVWRNGYLGRVTQDVDIALPADRIEVFLQSAPLCGFDVLKSSANNWPKLQHRDTGIDVDILPEGGRPGTATKPAPTTIPHPRTMGAAKGKLKYISLPSLVELKVAAGRLRDEADVVELIRENAEQVAEIQSHLASVHQQYADRFAELIEQSKD
jgi:hypothetical protein